jgi:uncharacterized repeat protein (TIGR02543 family)
LAISQDGKLFVWGNNNNGQIFDSITSRFLSPENITSRFILPNWDKVVSAKLGQSHMVVVSENGRIFTSGLNSSGQLGDGSLNSKILSLNNSPVKEEYRQSVKSTFNYSPYINMPIPNIFEAVGYRNSEWYLSSNLNNPFVLPSQMQPGSYVLYTLITKNNYEINYNLNQGTNHFFNPDTVTVEDKILLKDPIRNNHVFEGWYLDADFSLPFDGLINLISQDLTVFAKWRLISS